MNIPTRLCPRVDAADRQQALAIPAASGHGSRQEGQEDTACAPVHAGSARELECGLLYALFS